MKGELEEALKKVQKAQQQTPKFKQAQFSGGTEVGERVKTYNEKMLAQQANILKKLEEEKTKD